MNAGSAHHCRKPNIQRFDYERLGKTVINRVCLTCKTHWWGSTEYSSEQWDALMSGFDWDAAIRSSARELFDVSGGAPR